MPRFGLFEFDSQTLELKREGVPVRLQAQPAQVLAILIEQAGTIVSRETLQARVWADGTQVDFERGLNYCIAQVRSALGDSADSPRFVRTIPKKGYQFIAPISDTVVVAEATPPRRIPWVWFGVAAVAILAIGAFALSKGFSRPKPVIAVCVFDNETGDPEMDRIANGFSDALTAELATEGDGRVLVIGNADILRKPRRERNLGTIHVQLGADFVIIGQLQKDASGARVLAHLLGMPKQTHVTVERLDAPELNQPLATEANFARSASKRFLAALEKRSSIAASH